jgi:hypothetical protein
VSSDLLLAAQSPSSDRLPIRALANTDAKASTTPHRHLIHDFQRVQFKNYMADALHKHHASLGQGFIKICYNDGPDDLLCFVMVHSWWTPTLHVTLFSPAATVERHKDLFKRYLTTLDHVALSGTATLHSCNIPAQDVFLGIKQRLLLYTVPSCPRIPKRYMMSPQGSHTCRTMPLRSFGINA